MAPPPLPLPELIPMAPLPLPELIPDAIAEILLRLTPSDPAGLVRASVVCKPWLRTLTDPAFLRRYRTFHGTSHVLGFLHNPTDRSLERSVPTTAFRPHAAAHLICAVLDCRHGRALLYDSSSSEFVVWDPVTGREHRIPDEAPVLLYTNHAVLCAAGAGCDHSTCSGGPFLLASVGMHSDVMFEEIAGTHCIAYGCFYSSETGETSTHTFLGLLCENNQCSLEDRPTTLVGGALYYIVTCSGSLSLLRYDVLGGCGLSVIQLPPAANCFLGGSTIVMTASHGGLGVATFYDGILLLWSAETCPNGDARWVLINVIDLAMLLPVDIHISTAWLSGLAEDANSIFLSTDDNGIFTIELKSLLTRKVCEMSNVKHVFPYVSFYTPAAFARGTLQSPVETQ